MSLCTVNYGGKYFIKISSFFKQYLHWQSFFLWNCWRQQHVKDNAVLGQHNHTVIISICVTLPKVAKASLTLCVTCCYRQQFNGKINDSFKQYLHWQIFPMKLPATVTQGSQYCSCLCHLGQKNKNMIISICVTLPMVAKASTALSVTCCYRQQFNGKINTSLEQYLHFKVFPMKLLVTATWRENIVLGQNNKNMIISVCITLPMVAKASTALSVTCCYRQQFNGKINTSLEQYLHLQSFSRETAGESSLWKTIQYLGKRTKTWSFAFVSLCPWWPRQVQHFLSHVAIANSLIGKSILPLSSIYIGKVFPVKLLVTAMPGRQYVWATQHKYDHFYWCHFVKGGQGV